MDPRQPITPEDFELLQQHLAKYPQQLPCPICRTKAWQVGGFETSLQFLQSGRNAMGGRTIPKVVLVCSECGFIRQFAWLRIKPSLVQREDVTPTGGGEGGDNG
jgi:hypothetical protein